MKSNPSLWGALAWLAAASVLAQEPARDAGAPAAPRGAAAAFSKDVVLNPPGIATIKPDSLTIRSQPAFAGDHLGTLKKGETVTVVEQITHAKPKLNEPANWARILLPTNATVWVFADYIDTNTMAVSARRINVRGGADDRFDVVARLEKGAPVKILRRVPDWFQIEPPTNAYGWIASDYLTMQPPAAVPPAAVVAAEPAAVASIAAAADTNTPVAAAPVTNMPVAVAAVTNEPVTPPATNTPAETTNVTLVTTPAQPIIAPEPVATTPPPPTNATPPAAAVVPAAVPAATTPGSDAKPRVVTREGFVRKAINIQAPSDYELRDANSGEIIEYLQPGAQDKNFQKYTGTRVSVTGPEWLDRRWPKTPILQIQTIDLMP